MLSEERYNLLLKRFNYDDGSVMMKLMKDQDAINSINSCNVDKLAILLDSNNHRNSLITRLQDFDICESGNSVDAQASEIQYEKLKLLIEYDKESNKMIMDMLENRNVVEIINGIDQERFKLLYIWSDYMKSVALRLIEESFVNVMDTTNIKIIKFLIEHEKSYDIFMMNLLGDKNVVNVVNYFEIIKLEILLDRDSVFYKTMKNVFELLQKSTDNKSGFPLCEIHFLRKESNLILETMEVLLNEEGIANTINTMITEKFMHLVHCGFRDTTSLKILESEGAMNTVNSLHIDKLDLFLTTASFDEKMIRIIEIEEAAKAIESIEIEEFVSNSRKLRVSIILKILELKNSIGTKILESIMKIGNHVCEKVYDFIESLEIEKLIILLKRYDYKGANQHSELLITKALTEKHIFKAMNEINLSKFKILLGKTVYDDKKILDLLEDETSLNSIMTMEYERFRILYLNFEHLDEGLTNVLMDTDTFEIVRFICPEKIEMLLNWADTRNNPSFTLPELVRNFLHNSAFVSFIKCVDIEKFKLISLCLSSANSSLEFLLRNAEAIINMDIEKFKYLFYSSISDRGYMVQQFLGDNWHMNHLLNSMDLNKFKIVFNSSNEENFIKIFGITEFDVRKHLLFAVALYKADIIRKITFSYITNENEALHDDIVRLFPKVTPIHRILEKTAPYDKEFVPKLEALCIEACIEVLAKARNDNNINYSNNSYYNYY